MKLRSDEILVLRTCTQEMRGTCSDSAAFVWPERGAVEAPDWVDDDQCGHGLHGLPWGEGGASLLSPSGIWMVVRVSTKPGRYQHGTGNMMGKCKFMAGIVVYSGNRSGAVRMLQEHAPAGTPIVYAEQIAPERPNQTQTAGDRSTQTAGDWSTQKAGYESTQTAGVRSTQTAGGRSTQTAGDESTQTAGDWSTQTAGDWSTQKAGYKSTQTAGDRSYQRGGLNTVQATIWYAGGDWHRACRVVTADMADRWYRVVSGVWTEITGAVEVEERRKAAGE